MKALKYLLVYAFAIILFSCNSGENNNAHDHDHNHDHDHTHQQQHENASADKYGMMMNNGAKWNSDAPTRVAFANMQGLLNSFQQTHETPVLADYNKLGNDLQAELDVLFKECRMEGQAHEQLHVLLVHIIDDVKILKGQDEKAAANAYEKVQEHLALFPEYFS